jgi:riboflavin transporter FmnP
MESRTDGTVRMKEGVEPRGCTLIDLKPQGREPWGSQSVSLQLWRVSYMKPNSQYRKLAAMGVLSAASIVLFLVIRFPIFPAVPFLIYEPADVALLMIGFALGPVAGLLCTALVCVLQAPLHPEGGWFGALMHFIASGALVGVSSVIYSRFRTRTGAYWGLAAGCAAMVAVMIPANLMLIPVFWHLPRQAVVSVLGWIVAFNVVKSGLNAAITAAVYKPLSRYIRGFEEAGSRPCTVSPPGTVGR